MNNKAILCINQIRRYFDLNKANIKVLESISFNICLGEFIYIYGPSGSGKSTLLHLIAALDEPTSGDISFNEKSIFKDMNKIEQANFRREIIGFVFQSNHLLPDFTALQNVALPLILQGISKKQALRKASEHLSKFNLNDRILFKPSELAKGEQQRVGIARALITNPQIILADEPSGSLDYQNREQLKDIFLELRDDFKKEKSFIIVSHDRTFENIATKVYELRNGILVDN